MNSLVWLLGVEGNLNNISLDIFVWMYTDYTLTKDHFALNVVLRTYENGWCRELKHVSCYLIMILDGNNAITSACINTDEYFQNKDSLDQKTL